MPGSSLFLRRFAGLVAVALLAQCSSCRAPAGDPPAAAEAVSGPPVSSRASEAPIAAPIEPFQIVLGMRGGMLGNRRNSFEYELNSDGRCVLRVVEEAGGSVVDGRLERDALVPIGAVLTTSLLRSSEGEYGRQVGPRMHGGGDSPRRSIDIRTPTERRRIEFDGLYGWRDYYPEDQAVLRDFCALWSVVAATIPEERHRNTVWCREILAELGGADVERSEGH